MSGMERRLLVILAALAVGVVAVGLSAAATMSRDDSARPASDAHSMKPPKKAVSQAPARKNDAPVVVSTGRSQNAKEVEQYWTKERMEDAQPMEKTRPGGSPSSSPAPSRGTVPGSAPTKSASAKKLGKTRSQSAGDTGVATSSATTSDPNYWTDDAMDDAQPMDKTRPGGTGSQGDPDPGGSTVPGSPPP